MHMSRTRSWSAVLTIAIAFSAVAGSASAGGPHGYYRFHRNPAVVELERKKALKKKQEKRERELAAQNAKQAEGATPPAPAAGPGVEAKE
jgi:hypothetical protein